MPNPAVKRTFHAIAWSIAAALTIAAVSSSVQARADHDLHEMTAGARLHDVTVAPAEYKSRKALKV